VPHIRSKHCPGPGRGRRSKIEAFIMSVPGPSFSNCRDRKIRRAPSKFSRNLKVGTRCKRHYRSPRPAGEDYTKGRGGLGNGRRRINNSRFWIKGWAPGPSQGQGEATMRSTSGSIASQFQNIELYSLFCLFNCWHPPPFLEDSGKPLQHLGLTPARHRCIVDTWPGQKQPTR
jgi:hypothetical protein